MAEPAKPQVKKPPEGGLLNLGGPGRNQPGPRMPDSTQYRYGFYYLDQILRRRSPAELMPILLACVSNSRAGPTSFRCALIHP